MNLINVWRVLDALTLEQETDSDLLNKLKLYKELSKGLTCTEAVGTDIQLILISRKNKTIHFFQTKRINEVGKFKENVNTKF